MKKKVLWLITGILCLFGFTLNTNAAEAPAKIYSGSNTKITNYINGYEAWLKVTSDNSHYLFCEVADLKFPSNSTLTKNSEVDKGFVYILNNRPNTGDYNKDFYIMQMAVWWYQDILNRNNANLDQNLKTSCENNKLLYDTCKKIIDLVNGAKNYKENSGNIKFSTDTIKFTESSGYYYSNEIKVTTENLEALNYPKLVNAPKNAVIINDKVNSLNGTGTLQVRIPVSSLSKGETINFSIELEGNYPTYSVYDYYYASGYQKVIYDEVFRVSHPVLATKALKITKESTTTTTTTKPVSTNSLTIYKVDQDEYNLKGATLTLYEGDCLNKTCSSRDIYATWTTTINAKEFIDIPVGYYTLVETETPEGYQKADKGLINIKRDDRNYTYTLVNVKENEVKPVRISKTDITNSKEIAGATLVIKDKSGKEVATWISENKPKYLTLAEGEYTLIEKYAPAGYKLTTTVVYFKVDAAGNVTAKDANGKYVAVEYLEIVNEVNDMVNISKLDSSTNRYLPGATLVLKNEKGEIVATWTTTNESYNITLNAGYYSITETTAPNGYDLNTEVVYFRVLEDGTLNIKNSQGIYELTNGIIIYNKPVIEEETVVVPKTGLSSIITYTIGGLTLLSGAYILVKNGQFNI